MMTARVGEGEDSVPLKIMGIPNAEEVLDAVKDYVENGEVWVYK